MTHEQKLYNCANLLNNSQMKCIISDVFNNFKFHHGWFNSQQTSSLLRSLNMDISFSNNFSLFDISRPYHIAPTIEDNRAEVIKYFNSLIDNYGKDIENKTYNYYNILIVLNCFSNNIGETINKFS